MGLGESVVDHIDIAGVFPEEHALLLGAHTNFEILFDLGPLGDILGEHVLRAVHITAEVVVVDLLGVSAVAVTANDQVKEGVAGRHQVQVFQNAQELLGGDVLRV